MASDDTRPAPSGAAATIRQAIEFAGGRLPFARFMDLALYGDDGFYTNGGRAGRRGDFLTSPEVGPLFGAVLARMLDAEWARLGHPEPFTVVEVGAGPGTLARALHAAGPAGLAAWRYVAVEVSAAQRARHPTWVESVSELPSVLGDGVVIANELLDNLPFRLAVYDGSWREAHVAVADDDRFVEVLGPTLEPRPSVLPAVAALGSRAPLLDAAHTWVTDVLQREGRGRVVVFDYARSTTAELASRPWRDWLRTYADHQRGRHYLADPGRQDITVDVALDQLPTPDVRTGQAAWLRRWGIDELVAEGVAAWEAAVGRPDLRALTMRSRVREVDALVDAAGLGGFDVMEWDRDRRS